MQRFKKLTQMLLKTGLLFVVIFDFGTQLKAQVKENSLKLQSVQKIWDNAPHNAFTDLIWHKGWFFLRVSRRNYSRFTRWRFAGDYFY
jgi:hypothetical protein